MIRRIVTLNVPDEIFEPALDVYCSTHGYQEKIIDPEWKSSAGSPVVVMPADEGLQTGEGFQMPELIDNPESKWDFARRIASERFKAEVIGLIEAQLARATIKTHREVSRQLSDAVEFVLLD